MCSGGSDEPVDVRRAADDAVQDDNVSRLDELGVAREVEHAPLDVLLCAALLDERRGRALVGG